MQTGKFNFWQGLNGIEGDEVVIKQLADGEVLVSRGQLYLIKTGDNSYRGIDEKFDTEALQHIKSV